MSDTQKGTVVHAESADYLPQKKGFKQNVKRHCARFWWLHLIIFIVVAVLAVVLIIFVAVPKIVQQKLDEAELSIEGIRVTNPTSNSLTMSINSTIRADDSVHARIEGFTGVMYLEDLEGHEPFARIDFPETTTKKIQTVNVTQDMQIDNIDALATFNTWLVSNETLRVTVEGDTKVHVKGLSKAYGATFKKTIELNGLNNFSGLRVTSASISLTPDENGDNFKGFTNIPNRSIFTLEVGTASFSTVFEGEEVGTTVLDDMVLYPGDTNNITMHANVDQLPIVNAISERPYCEGAPFPFELTAINITTRDGQNLTYYGTGLSRTTQTVDIPIGEMLERDIGLEAECA